MYHHLAHWYDWQVTVAFAESMADRLDHQLISQGAQPPGLIVDLACGTGTAAIRLASLGWRVVGVDIATAMLDVAKAKATEQQANPALLSWQQGDMRTWQPDSPVDAVLCSCDSVNHLLAPADVQQLFANVRQWLKPSGTFLFDTNTEAWFKAHWNGSDSDEGPNCRMTTHAHYDAQSGLAVAEFILDEHTDKGLMVTQEEVRERFYPETDIEVWLAAAGFTTVEKTGYQLPDMPEEMAHKTIWTVF